MEAANQVNMYAVQLTEVDVPNIHMMCMHIFTKLSLAKCGQEIPRYKWRVHAVWLSHELLMEYGNLFSSITICAYNYACIFW